MFALLRTVRRILHSAVSAVFYPWSRIVIAGSVCTDAQIPLRSIRRRPNELVLTTRNASWTIDVIQNKEALVSGTKLTASNVDSFDRTLAQAGRYQLGGGGYNSVCALADHPNRVIDEVRDIALVMESEPPRELLADMVGREVSVSPIGRRPWQKNVVLLDPSTGERDIVRGPSKPSLRDVLVPGWRWMLKRFRHSMRALLINSVRCEPLIEHLIGQAERNKAPVFAVLTRTSSPQLRLRVLLRRSDVAICNLDEFGDLCALAMNQRDPVLDEAHADLDDLAVKLQSLVMRTASRAGIVLTLGSRGFLIYDPATRSVAHGSIDPTVMKLTSLRLEQFPDARNGTGDAFAAYMLLAWLRRSVETPAATSLLIEAARQAALDVIRVRFGVEDACIDQVKICTISAMV